MPEVTFLEALRQGLWEEMERDERVFLLGEDIGVYGGAFKVTEGFIERFGPGRVMDTPIAEETIVGMALGAAMEGFRPVAEFQYADFMSSGFDEITTALARYHYRSGVPAPVVLRAPSGGGVRASSFHSFNPEPWFAHTPGLKVICPAFPGDAKGLLKSAIRDDNPVVFLEHKWIYRRVKEVVSEDPDFLVPIGKEPYGYDNGYFAHCLTNAHEFPERLADVQLWGDIRDIGLEALSGVDAVVQLSAVSNDPMGNRFEGVITEVKRDKLAATVEIRSGPHRVLAFITREAADQMHLAPGMQAVAAVKATNVTIELPG